MTVDDNTVHVFSLVLVTILMSNMTVINGTWLIGRKHF